jgi:TonB family protein
MTRVIAASSYLIKVAAATGITFLLFIIIPILHSIFGFDIDEAKALRQKPRVLIEKIPQLHKEEPKEVQRGFRKARSNQTNAMAGMGNAMSFKFTPDLAIEGSNGVAVQGQQDLQAVIFEEGETDEDFVPVYTPAPPYPERARELEAQGVLEVVMVIDIDGKVSSYDVIRSPHPSITAEFRKIVTQWRFKPAKNKGVPVRVRARKVIEYTLE